MSAAQWQVWSTTARVVVTDPGALGDAVAVVTGQLDEVDRAASRFRPDSEVCALAVADGGPRTVSPLLAELLEVALEAARRTDGDVDPLLGGVLRALGYDRDLRQLPVRAPAVRLAAAPRADWREVSLEGRTVRLPPGAMLDLGATAKAWAADASAARAAERTGAGVLVSLGGDIATAGPAPDGGWSVLVRDRPGDPACTVALPAGAAVATSSTVSRTWRRGEQLLHHLLDPRTASPAVSPWRSVTVAARDCVTANTLTTSAVLRRAGAAAMLHRTGLPARLVGLDGDVVTVGAWPAGPGVAA